MGRDDGPDFFEEGPVHLFYADLESYAASVEILRKWLSGEERAREERFRRREDREGFVVARGLLRAILGRCANRDPGDIRLVSRPGEKPAIDRDANPENLRFSVSHTGSRALYAVTRSRELGVDAERIRQDFPFLQVVDRYFSPREAAAVRAASEAERPAVFFAFWTLKEAFLKGIGKGFSLPPDRFEIALGPPEIVSVEGDPDAVSRWSLRTFHPEPGYIAALAVEGPPSPVALHVLRPGREWGFAHPRTAYTVE